MIIGEPPNGDTRDWPAGREKEPAQQGQKLSERRRFPPVASNGTKEVQCEA